MATQKNGQKAIVGLTAMSAAAMLAQAAGAQLRISAVANAGGNATGGPNADFVEIFNPGTDAVSLAGWAVQVSTGTSTSWTAISLPGVASIPAGRFYLVRCGSTSATGTAFTPDFTSSTVINSSGAKVALTNTVTLLTGSCPTSGSIVDFIGLATDGGTAPSCFEGAPVSPFNGFSTNRQAVRRCVLTDTNNNAADFEVRTGYAPRNSSTAAFTGGPAITAAGGAPSTVSVGETVVITANVSACGTSSGFSVIANLTTLGGSSTQVLLDDGIAPDAVAGDNIFTFALAVPGTVTTGAKALSFTATDSLSRTVSSAATVNVAAPAFPIKVSAVFGNGGSGGSIAANADFVELYNSGSVAADLTGYSVQNAFGNGTTWTQWNMPAGTTIPAGGFLLLRVGATNTTGFALTPDLTFSSSGLFSSDAKVAVVRNQSTLNGTTGCPLPNPLFTDFVGWGSGSFPANCFEGTALGAHGASNAFVRVCSGTQDTNNNAADFSQITGYTPRNLSSPPATSGPSAGTLAATPTGASVGETVTFTQTVITCGATGITVTANVSGLGGTTLALLDNGIAPDVTAGDNIFTGSFTIVAAAPGPVAVPTTITDDQSRTASASVNVSVLAPSFPIKISAAYGNGGVNSLGANADFIELYNAGSVAADLTGYSVQAAFGNGTSWTEYNIPPATTIPANGFLLLQLTTPGTVGFGISADVFFTSSPLFTSDAKIVVSRNQTSLDGTSGCPLPNPLYTDFVGWGSGAFPATCFEGTALGAHPADSGWVRRCNGVQDTNNNLGDFTAQVGFVPRGTTSGPVTGGPAFQGGLATGSPVSPGGSSNVFVTVLDCGASGIGVTLDATAVGGVVVTLLDNGVSPDAVAGDNVFATTLTGITGLPGVYSLPVTITDSLSRTASGSVSLAILAPAFPITISQLNPNGGDSSLQPNADYIELYNAGSVPADLTGYTIQTQGPTGTSWTIIQLPDATTIAPNSYFLVQMEDPFFTGYALSADFVSTNFSTPIFRTGGKAALVRSPASLAGTCPVGAAEIVDFVGYGTATCSETSPAAGLGALGAAVDSLYRACAGSTDTNNNAADFSVGVGVARNAASPAYGGGPTLGTIVASPASFDSGSSVTLTAVVGACGTPPITVLADLTSVGGGPSATMTDDGIAPDAVAGDGIFTVSFIATGAGSRTIPVTVSDAASRTANGSTSVNIIAPSFPVRISAAYGGGGGASLAANADFIELYNSGSVLANLTGYSVQAAFGNGTTWTEFNIPDGTTIPAGGYLLIQVGATSSTGFGLTPDLIFTSSPLFASDAKIVIRRNQVSLDGTSGCPLPNPLYTDFIGWGSGSFPATCFEGAALGAHATGSSWVRGCQGLNDTNNNLNDFSQLANYAPRNSSSPVFFGGAVISLSSGTPATGLETGSVVTLSATIDLACGAVAPVTVSADASAINAGTVAMLDDGVAPDAVAGDNVFTATVAVGAGAPAGNRTVVLTATDALARSNSRNVTLNVNAPAQSIRISQINGLGNAQGTAGPNADYIELYNFGATAVNLTNYAIQTSTATSSFWTVVALPDGLTVPANGYALVQMGTSGVNGFGLSPDFTTTTTIDSSNKIALTRNRIALSGTCPIPSGVVVDFVGYGTATCFETAPAPVLLSGQDNALLRGCRGENETNNNSLDFFRGPSNPRNTGVTNPGGPEVGSVAANPSAAPSGSGVIVTVQPNLCGSIIAGVTADATTVGGAVLTLLDNGIAPDAVAGDGIFTASFTATGLIGAYALPVTITDTLSRTASGSINFQISPPLFDIKISGLFGAGGFAGTAGANADYVELVNTGSVAADLTGYTVQVASATGSTWQVVPIPGGTILPAGGYYLVRTEDEDIEGFAYTADTSFSTFAAPTTSTGGKAAIVASEVSLAGNCPLPNPLVRDFVGYGTATDCREGSGTAQNAPAALTSPAQALYRLCQGTFDTNVNSVDIFAAASTTPRNSFSPVASPAPEFTAFPVSAVGAGPGETVVIAARVRDCGGTGITVNVDLSAILGGPTALALLDNGVAPDAAAGDGIFTANFTVPGGAPQGTFSMTATVSDSLSRTGTAVGSISVTAPSFPIKISQSYGFGGLDPAGADADYVELYNAGSVPADLTGYSLQLNGGTGAAWTVYPLSGTIAPNSYFLVQVEIEDIDGFPLTPDQDTTVTFSPLTSGSGKVAVVRSTAALTVACPFPSGLLADFLGYGTTTDCREGATTADNAAAASGLPLAQTRDCRGAEDTNINAADFTNQTPNPRNSASPANAGLELGSPTATPASVTAGNDVTVSIRLNNCGIPLVSPVVTIDTTNAGGSPGQAMFDDGTNGDAIAGDGIYTLTFTTGVFASGGTQPLAVSAVDGARSASGSISVVIVQTPLGACCEGSGALITCTQRTLAQCQSLSGFFLGEGIPCLEQIPQPFFEVSPAPFALIPDGTTPGASVTLVIDSSGAVVPPAGIAVTLGITHTWIGDLTATISNGTVTATLFERVGRIGGTGTGDSSDLGGTYRFFDDAAGDLWAAAAANTVGPITPGNYRATGADNNTSSLANFAGQPVDGTWTLTVTDLVSIDAGSISAFGIETIVNRQSCCRADFNRDGIVNDDDLGEFITSYFEIFAGPGGYAVTPCPDAEPPFNTLGYRADFTLDCTLNDDDLGGFITAFFAGCPE